MEISLMPHGKWLLTHSCSRTIHVASHVSSRYLNVWKTKARGRSGRGRVYSL